MKLDQALVIGGDGRLGKALVAELLRSNITTASTTRRPDVGLPFVDLLDPTIPPAFLQMWYIFVVAAVTGFGPCEQGGDSWRVNADAPGIIARTCPGRTIFVSSDAVEYAPHTAYAKQKAYAELAVLASGGWVLRCGRIPEDRYGHVARALIDLVEAPAGTLRRWQA